MKKINKALVVGGSSGIGLAVALKICNIATEVIIVDMNSPKISLPLNLHYIKVDLKNTDFRWLNKYPNIDFLFYSAGIGRVTAFENLTSIEIEKIFKVNTISFFKILHYYIKKLTSNSPFYCGLMVSISGRIASPLFSIYSGSKAALSKGVEAINTELSFKGTENRILEVSPGSLSGTSFNGGETDLNKLDVLAKEIVKKMLAHEMLYIPQYEEIFKNVILNYINNPIQFAQDSYKYKINNNRLQDPYRDCIGYLSGSFDLFHIGHLNLIRRAKEQCDYLVVGVHKDGSHKGIDLFIPFEERMEILKSLKYVDDVIESEKEDVDIYKKGIVKYNKLFVGSDYKGTERFNRYENFFKDKNVKIIYFPYTKSTNSTQLRNIIQNSNDKRKI